MTKLSLIFDLWNLFTVFIMSILNNCQNDSTDRQARQYNKFWSVNPFWQLFIMENINTTVTRLNKVPFKIKIAFLTIFRTLFFFYFILIYYKDKKAKFGQPLRNWKFFKFICLFKYHYKYFWPLFWHYFLSIFSK